MADQGVWEKDEEPMHAMFPSMSIDMALFPFAGFTLRFHRFATWTCDDSHMANQSNSEFGFGFALIRLRSLSLMSCHCPEPRSDPPTATLGHGVDEHSRLS